MSALLLLRRFFALFLILPFVLFFVLTLGAFRLDATVLEASFYTETLQKLDFYNFLYDVAIPAALDEAKEEGTLDLKQDLPLGVAFTNDEVVDFIERVLPREWVQENLELVIGQAMPYITGDEDDFNITVPVADRVTDAIGVVEEWITDADTYTFLIDDVVAPEVEKNGSLLDDLPYGISLTAGQVIQGVEQVVDKAWLDQRADEVVGEVSTYITGERDSFSVLIPLQDRAEEALSVLQGWFLEALDSGAYDYLLQEQMVPVIRQQLGSAVTLPYGVIVTDDQIVDALAEVLPQEWLAERINDAFDAFGPYLTGREDTFTLSIPLRERVAVSVAGIVAAVDAEYQALFESLPTCTLVQLPGLNLSLDELPECLPLGVGYDQVKALVGLDIVEALTDAVVDQIPDSIAFTEQDLEAAMGDAADLDQARDLLKNGLTFTDEDLRELILEEAGQDELDFFDDVRMALRDGITFTDQDLRDEMGSDSISLDDGRDWIKRVRQFLLVLLVPLVLLMVTIGFLGGRNWWSRLAWAGVPLVLAGAIVAGSLGAAKDILRTFTEDPIQDLEIVQVFIDKLLEVRGELVSTFVDPMLFQGIIALVVGLGMLLVGVFAPVIVCRRAQHVIWPEPDQPPSMQQSSE
jgi:hypothetical protein